MSSAPIYGPDSQPFAYQPYPYQPHQYQPHQYQPHQYQPTPSYAPARPLPLRARVVVFVTVGISLAAVNAVIGLVAALLVIFSSLGCTEAADTNRCTGVTGNAFATVVCTFGAGVLLGILVAALSGGVRVRTSVLTSLSIMGVLVPTIGAVVGWQLLVAALG